MKSVKCISQREIFPNDLSIGAKYWLDENSIFEIDGEEYARIYTYYIPKNKYLLGQFKTSHFVYEPIISNETVKELYEKAEDYIKESIALEIEADRYLEEGNELEWEESLKDSIDKDAYARGIKDTLEMLGFIE